MYKYERDNYEDNFSDNHHENQYNGHHLQYQKYNNSSYSSSRFQNFFDSSYTQLVRYDSRNHRRYRPHPYGMYQQENMKHQHSNFFKLDCNRYHEEIELRRSETNFVSRNRGFGNSRDRRRKRRLTTPNRHSLWPSYYKKYLNSFSPVKEIANLLPSSKDEKASKTSDNKCKSGSGNEYTAPTDNAASSDNTVSSIDNIVKVAKTDKEYPTVSEKETVLKVVSNAEVLKDNTCKTSSEEGKKTRDLENTEKQFPAKVEEGNRVKRNEEANTEQQKNIGKCSTKDREQYMNHLRINKRSCDKSIKRKSSSDSILVSYKILKMSDNSTCNDSDNSDQITSNSDGSSNKFITEIKTTNNTLDLTPHDIKNKEESKFLESLSLSEIVLNNKQSLVSKKERKIPESISMPSKIAFSKKDSLASKKESSSPKSSLTASKIAFRKKEYSASKEDDRILKYSPITSKTKIVLCNQEPKEESKSLESSSTPSKIAFDKKDSSTSNEESTSPKSSSMPSKTKIALSKEKCLSIKEESKSSEFSSTPSKINLSKKESSISKEANRSPELSSLQSKPKITFSSKEAPASKEENQCRESSSSPTKIVFSKKEFSVSKEEEKSPEPSLAPSKTKIAFDKKDVLATKEESKRPEFSSSPSRVAFNNKESSASKEESNSSESPSTPTKTKMTFSSKESPVSKEENHNCESPSMPSKMKKTFSDKESSGSKVESISPESSSTTSKTKTAFSKKDSSASKQESISSESLSKAKIVCSNNEYLASNKENDRPSSPSTPSKTKKAFSIKESYPSTEISKSSESLLQQAKAKLILYNKKQSEFRSIHAKTKISLSNKEHSSSKVEIDFLDSSSTPSTETFSNKEDPASTEASKSSESLSHQEKTKKTKSLSSPFKKQSKDYKSLLMERKTKISFNKKEFHKNKVLKSKVKSSTRQKAQNSTLPNKSAHHLQNKIKKNVFVSKSGIKVKTKEKVKVLNDTLMKNKNEKTEEKMNYVSEQLPQLDTTASAQPNFKSASNQNTKLIKVIGSLKDDPRLKGNESRYVTKKEFLKNVTGADFGPKLKGFKFTFERITSDKNKKVKYDATHPVCYLLRSPLYDYLSEEENNTNKKSIVPNENMVPLECNKLLENSAAVETDAKSEVKTKSKTAKQLQLCKPIQSAFEQKWESIANIINEIPTSVTAQSGVYTGANNELDFDMILHEIGNATDIITVKQKTSNETKRKIRNQKTDSVNHLVDNSGEPAIRQINLDNCKVIKVTHNVAALFLAPLLYRINVYKYEKQTFKTVREKMNRHLISQEILNEDLKPLSDAYTSTFKRIGKHIIDYLNGIDVDNFEILQFLKEVVIVFKTFGFNTAIEPVVLLHLYEVLSLFKPFDKPNFSQTFWNQTMNYTNIIISKKREQLMKNSGASQNLLGKPVTNAGQNYNVARCEQNNAMYNYTHNNQVPTNKNVYNNNNPYLNLNKNTHYNTGTASSQNMNNTFNRTQSPLMNSRVTVPDMTGKQSNTTRTTAIPNSEYNCNYHRPDVLQQRPYSTHLQLIQQMGQCYAPLPNYNSQTRMIYNQNHLGGPQSINNDNNPRNFRPEIRDSRQQQFPLLSQRLQNNYSQPTQNLLQQMNPLNAQHFTANTLNKQMLLERVTPPNVNSSNIAQKLTLPKNKKKTLNILPPPPYRTKYERPPVAVNHHQTQSGITWNPIPYQTVVQSPNNISNNQNPSSAMQNSNCDMSITTILQTPSSTEHTKPTKRSNFVTPNGNQNRSSISQTDTEIVTITDILSPSSSTSCIVQSSSATALNSNSHHNVSSTSQGSGSRLTITSLLQAPTTRPSLPAERVPPVSSNDNQNVPNIAQLDAQPLFITPILQTERVAPVNSNSNQQTSTPILPDRVSTTLQLRDGETNTRIAFSSISSLPPAKVHLPKSIGNSSNSSQKTNSGTNINNDFNNSTKKSSEKQMHTCTTESITTNSTLDPNPDSDFDPMECEITFETSLDVPKLQQPPSTNELVSHQNESLILENDDEVTIVDTHQEQPLPVSLEVEVFSQTPPKNSNSSDNNKNIGGNLPSEYINFEEWFEKNQRIIDEIDLDDYDDNICFKEYTYPNDVKLEKYDEDIIIVEEKIEEIPPRISSVDSGISGICSPKLDDNCICGLKADFVCSCRTAVYCSKRCQEVDWHCHQIDCTSK